jgi:hypothetical protein
MIIGCCVAAVVKQLRRGRLEAASVLVEGTPEPFAIGRGLLMRERKPVEELR